MENFTFIKNIEELEQIKREQSVNDDPETVPKIPDILSINTNKTKPKNILGTNGHIKCYPYTIQPCGRFGDFFINQFKLRHNGQLVCKDLYGNEVLNKSVGKGTVRLLTKQRILCKGKEVPKQDINDFRQLVKMSKIKPHIGSKKYKYLSNLNTVKSEPPAPVTKVIFVNSKEELVEKFKTLIAHKSILHNDGVDNEIVAILDELLKRNLIDKQQHKEGIRRFIPELLK